MLLEIIKKERKKMIIIEIILIMMSCWQTLIKDNYIIILVHNHYILDLISLNQ